MPRATRLLPAALLTLALAGCGNTPAEQSYLDVIRDRSSLVDIDEGEALVRGETICGALGNIKPDDRRTAAGLLLGQGFAFHELDAATRHLCPDLGVTL